MHSKALDWLRRRPLVGIAGSLALHLLLVGALVWVRPPTSDANVKRGEPLFVELPPVEEPAPRGLPGGPQAAQTPPVVPRPASPPRPEGGPKKEGGPKREQATPPRPIPHDEPRPQVPEPPKVASAPPVPKPDAPEPVAAGPAVAPPDIPAADEAPKPAEAPRSAEALTRAEAPRSADARAEPQNDPAGEAAGAGGGPKVAALPDVRSALRRGGSGGAGGRGEGRAGIEGEPIPLDSKDPKYNDYLDRVRRLIKSKWAYPCVKNRARGECEYKSAQLVVEFGILKEGRVPFVTVLKQSEFDVYDEYAVNAIKLAAPFPPVPPPMMAAAKPGSTGISITVHFIYVLESSLTNLLR